MADYTTTTLVIHTATDSTLTHLVPLILTTSAPPPPGQLKMLKYIDQHPNHTLQTILSSYKEIPATATHGPFGLRLLTARDLPNISTQPNLQLPITQGWLRKKGSTRRAWSNRYFTVMGGYLFYAKEEPGKLAAPPVGCIPLRLATISLPESSAATPDTVSPGANFKKHANTDARFGFEFHLVTPGRTYTLIASTPTSRTQWCTTVTSLTSYYATSVTTLTSVSPHIPTTLTMFSSDSFVPQKYVDNFFLTNPTSHASHTVGKLNECHGAAADLIRDVVVSQHPSFIMAGGVARGCSGTLASVRKGVEGVVRVVEGMAKVEFEGEEDYEGLGGSDCEDGFSSSFSTSSSRSSSPTPDSPSDDDAALQSIESLIARLELSKAVALLTAEPPPLSPSSTEKLTAVIAALLDTKLTRLHSHVCSSLPHPPSSLFLSPTALSLDCPPIQLLLMLNQTLLAVQHYTKSRSLLLASVRSGPVHLATERPAIVIGKANAFFECLAECIEEFQTLTKQVPAKLVLWVDCEIERFVGEVFSEAGSAKQSEPEESEAAIMAACFTGLLEEAEEHMGRVGLPVTGRVAGLIKKRKGAREASLLMEEGWRALVA